MILLWLSLPFALVALGCFVMSQREGGWDGLGWAVWMAGVLALWAVVALGFFVWLMSREGLLAWHGVPLALCVLAVLAATGWGLRTWHGHATERADVAFWERLAAAPFAERAALLDAEPERPAAIGYAGREILALHFFADPYAPLPEGDERLATLALLFDRGLPPDDTLLHMAVGDDDPPVVRLIVARRAASGGLFVPAPPQAVEQALGNVDPDPGSPYHARHERAVAILAVFLEAGFDPCQPLTTAETFRDAFERRGVPRDLWAAAAERC